MCMRLINWDKGDVPKRTDNTMAKRKRTKGQIYKTKLDCQFNSYDSHTIFYLESSLPN